MYQFNLDFETFIGSYERNHFYYLIIIDYNVVLLEYQTLSKYFNSRHHKYYSQTYDLFMNLIYHTAKIFIYNSNIFQILSGYNWALI